MMQLTAERATYWCRPTVTYVKRQQSRHSDVILRTVHDDRNYITNHNDVTYRRHRQYDRAICLTVNSNGRRSSNFQMAARDIVARRPIDCCGRLQSVILASTVIW